MGCKSSKTLEEKPQGNNQQQQNGQADTEPAADQ
mgnify:FL=1